MADGPEPQLIAEVAALKALTHPRRQRILQSLGRNGPATSAMLATALGLNTGATSYHLRELARYGFVTEVPGQARGRERWWRRAHQDLRFPPWRQQSAELRAVFEEVHQRLFAADVADFARATEQAAADESEWADVIRFSRGAIRVNPAEVGAFFEAYIDLLNRYNRPDEETPADAGTVLVRLFVYPPPQEDS